jgi:hypothetical protein
MIKDLFELLISNAKIEWRDYGMVKGVLALRLILPFKNCIFRIKS